MCCADLALFCSRPKMDRHSHNYQTLLKTVYREAPGEPEEGQLAVAWVIKNRADKNRAYWGGNSIAAVCRHPGQFECWNPGDISMHEHGAGANIERWLDRFYERPDPTGGADHFHNPDKEGFPGWTNNCRWGVKIGNHQFYHRP
ncbi:spore cortex-lytic enzyme-like [Paramacrobiotus metropolitanus]|uniref:spore cortex-lytic enzyme-like n=1 Tax=Paramacrobiotus metropolitanus TaxID=2943436 RepID=UPI0024456E37|nr:spore cortex-lytic enzyme-like [Paramacrobiotus metropolitanus]